MCIRRKRLPSKVLPTHSHFCHCCSTSCTPVLRLPGWGLQIPVIPSVHSRFLKPGAPCSGLRTRRGEHPIRERPGGIHCPGSFPACSHTPMGDAAPPAQSLAREAPKATGLLWLLHSKTSAQNVWFQGDYIQIPPFISHCVRYITVFKTKEISLQQGRKQNKTKQKITPKPSFP